MVNIYLDDGIIIEAYTCIGNLNILMEYGYFYKCHRCYIVNLYKIKQIVNGYSSIILNNEIEVSISRNRKKDFKKSLGEICKKMGVSC